MVRRSWWVLCLAIALFVGACTSATDSSSEGEQGQADEPPSAEEDSTTDPSGPPTTDPGGPLNETPNTLPGGPPGFEVLGDLAGRLAITDGPALVLIDPSGQFPDVIDEAVGGRLGQPTWSGDGTLLAWSSLIGGEGTLHLFEIESGVRQELATDNTSAIYLQWTHDGSRLGLLQNEGEEIALSWVGLNEAGEFEGRLRAVDVGVPFYFSWAADDQTMATHLGSTLAVRGDGRTEELIETDQVFTAPYWVDERTILAAREGALSLVNAASGLVTEVAELAGPTQFVLSADGSRVAYLAPGNGVRTVSLDSQVGPVPSTLRVLDLATGSDTIVTHDLALAWEWSPDGNRLAYLAPSEFDEEKLRWYFWQSGSTIGATSEHIPSDVELREYLPFFTQYAQSHTRWEPTGEAFVFAGTVQETSGIFVHVIGQTPQSIQVANGDYATWSPESVANSGGISPL